MEELKPREQMLELGALLKLLAGARSKTGSTAKVPTDNLEVKFIYLRGSLFEVNPAAVGSLVSVFQIFQRQIGGFVFSSEKGPATEIAIIIPMFSDGLDVLTYVVARRVKQLDESYNSKSN